MLISRGAGRRGRKRLLIKAAVLLIVIIISGILFLELRLIPVMESVSALQAKSLATAEINEAVTDILSEDGMTGETLESITSDGSGRISSICTDTAAANRLKNLVTLRAQERLCSIRSRRVDIPLGTIIGSRLLNGTGPVVPVYISMSGTVTSDFDSCFESGGINQTVHRLSVNISADIRVLMPLCSTSETVSTSVLVGETVIVGDTPDGLITTPTALNRQQ